MWPTIDSLEEEVLEIESLFNFSYVIDGLLILLNVNRYLKTFNKSE